MASAANLPILEMRNARVSRTKGDFSFALHIPLFTACAGEFVMLLGPNGSGKSTCLDLLALILSADSCDEFVLRPLDRAPVDLGRASGNAKARIRQQCLGYVMQSGGLLPFLSLGANIQLPGLLGSMSARARRQRLDSMMSAFDLRGQLRKKPSEVSGGERQWAAVARALMHSPSVVLADEPTASVYRPKAREIVSMLKEQCAHEGRAVIVATHDEELMAPFADRIYRFEKGFEAGNSRALSVCVEDQGGAAA
jgi:putative ABC transport system ATP-binding protein